jgi:uncharacterized protein YkwD
MVPVLLLSLIAGLSASPVLADEVVPPPPPVVDIPPPPPIPANIDPSEVRHAVARPVYEKPAPSEVRRASYETQVAQPAQTAQVQYASYGDPYGFTSWLNGVRAQYGLGPVSYDPNLSGQAAVNNGQQHARGMGHHYMGSARRQNSGMGAAQTVWQMWMASPAHQAALLDPTITMIGIAASGSYWTFNAY